MSSSIAKPILFSAAMVRALLAGTKTQTRRTIQIPRRGAFVVVDDGGGWWSYQSDDGASALCNDGNEYPMACPYGGCGDRLWVKEAIRHVGGCSEYIADGAPTVADAWPWQPKALPGMFCPRGLSRITLEVTEVRVQRLQEISAEDSLAEGVPRASACGCEVCPRSVQMCPADASEQVLAYAALWDSINSKRAGCAWADNPWVWCVSFRKVP